MGYAKIATFPTVRFVYFYSPPIIISEQERLIACTASCPEGMVKCDKEKCILESLMCDGEADCADGTDEPTTCGENPIAWLYVGEGRRRLNNLVP